MRLNDRRKAAWGIFGYFALFFICQLAVSLVASVVAVAKAMREYPDASSEAHAAIANATIADVSTLLLLFSGVLTIAAVYAVGVARKQPVTAVLSLRTGFAPLLIPVLLVAGVFGNLWFSTVLELLPLSEETLRSYSEAAGALTTSYPMIDFMTIVVIAPLAEELIFRGMILSGARKVGPVWMAVLLQAVLFGTAHSTPLWMSYAAVLGCILGYIVVCTGSLWAGVLFHVAFNAGSYAVEFIGERVGTETPTVLVMMLVSALVFAAALFFVSRQQPRHGQKAG